jgi:hypothetical protein
MLPSGPCHEPGSGAGVSSSAGTVLSPVTDSDLWRLRQRDGTLDRPRYQVAGFEPGRSRTGSARDSDTYFPVPGSRYVGGLRPVLRFKPHPNVPAGPRYGSRPAGRTLARGGDGRRAADRREGYAARPAATIPVHSFRRCGPVRLRLGFHLGKARVVVGNSLASRAVAVLHRVIYVSICDDQGLRFRRPGTPGALYGRGNGYATARGRYSR